MMYKLIVISVLLFSFINSFSQEDEFEKNVRIVSKYKTVLSKAKKLDYKPIIKDTVVQNPSFDYFLKTKQFKSFYNLVENDYPKYSGREGEQYEDNYLRLGGGNNKRFQGEYAYNNPIHNKYNFGIYLNSNSISGTINHRGKDREIGLIDQRGLFYLSKFEEQRSYGLSMSYNRYLNHLYGGVKYIDMDKKRKGLFTTNLFYNDVLSSGIKYGAKLDYTNFVDVYSDALENYIDVDAHVAIDVDGAELNVKVGLDYLNSRNDIDFSSLSIEPHYKLSAGKFKFDLGFGVSQYMGENYNLYYYPKTNIYFDVLGKELSLYATLDGGVENNNFFNSWKTNPFVVVMNSIQTYTQYSVGGGLKGRIDNLFWYDLGMFYSKVDNYKSYSLEKDRNNFVQMYTNLRMFSFDIEFGMNIDDNFSIISQFTSYTFNIERPTNVPSCEITFNGKYKFSDKLSISSNLYMLGERKIGVGDAVDPTEYDTNGIIFDLSSKAEYSFSKYLHVYGRVNNIFNKNYQRWEECPVMGINILAGFTICF